MDVSDEVGHDRLRNMLGAYALGTLTGHECQRVDSHLSRCSPCREELPQLVQAAGALLSGRDADPPAELWESIRSRLHRRSDGGAPEEAEWVGPLPL